MIGKSDALNGIMFTIENLLSNTAYHVVVQANGPLGSVNSTSKVFYTTPNKVQGKFTKRYLHLLLIGLNSSVSKCGKFHDFKGTIIRGYYY